MKGMLMLLALMALCFPMSIYAQGEEEPQSIYIEGTRSLVATHSDVSSYWCDQNASRSLTFDLESISGGDLLDLAIGQSIRLTLGWPGYYGFQNYNSGSGTFPEIESDFLYNYVQCSDNDRILNFVFGHLRQERKDLAVVRQTGTYIYYNTGSGIATSANQSLSGNAIDATWGAFTSNDNYEDLAVTSGSEVRIYPNMNNGNVGTTPYTFSVPARRVILAQMDGSIFDPPTTNKLDLVSISGNGAQTDNLVSIRLNNGSNGFGTAQEIDMGDEYIYSVAVGDINNDNFNDVIVAMSGDVRLYLNDGAGEIETTPTWSITSGVPSNPQVLIGDLGNTSDGSSNDGWNDLLLTGYEAPVKIFINQGSGTYFNSSPEESFNTGSPYTQVAKVMLADVQNTGGLSFIYALYGSSGQIYVNKHLGDPAPAPPKNIGLSSSNGQYGNIRVSWAANQERDLSSYEVSRKVDLYGGNWEVVASSITNTYWVDPEYLYAPEGGDFRPTYRARAKDTQGSYSSYSAEVSVRAEQSGKIAVRDQGAPKMYCLSESYPNPFNPTTEIKFDLPEGGNVLLTVYDVLGRRIGELGSGYREAGYHSATWNASGIASGVYIVRLSVSNPGGKVVYVKANKLVLTK